MQRTQTGALRAEAAFAGTQSRRIRSCRATRTVTAVLAPFPGADTAASTTADLKKLSLITALKTPYLSGGKFDLDSYDRLVADQISHGVEGLIVGGTTGEGHLMSWDEHIMLIAHTVNQFGRDIKVIGNTGSNSTREAIHATEQGFAVGMHAALQINPYYGKTSMTGLKEHFKAVLEEGPTMIYNVPGRTSQDIPDDVILGIASHANFLGVKECTGNDRIKTHAGNGITVWGGNDDEAHEARHSYGSQGVVSVTSNLIPGVFSSLMQTRDDKMDASIQELMAWLFCEPNPICLNTALSMCGLIRPVFRLPYVPLSKEQRVKGASLLEGVREHLPAGVKEIRVMEDSEFELVKGY